MLITRDRSQNANQETQHKVQARADGVGANLTIFMGIILISLVLFILFSNFIIPNIIINKIYNSEDFRHEIWRGQGIISSNGNWIIKRILDSSITIQSLRFPYQQHNINLLDLGSNEDWTLDYWYRFQWSPDGDSLILPVIQGRSSPQNKIAYIQFSNGEWQNPQYLEISTDKNTKNFFPFWSTNGKSLMVYSENLNTQNKVEEVNIDFFSAETDHLYQLKYKLSTDDTSFFSTDFSILPFSYDQGVILQLSNFEKTRLIILNEKDGHLIQKIDLSASGQILGVEDEIILFVANEYEQKKDNDYFLIDSAHTTIQEFNFPYSEASLIMETPIGSNDDNFIGFSIQKTYNRNGLIVADQSFIVWEWEKHHFSEYGKIQDIVGWHQKIKCFEVLKDSGLGFSYLSYIIP